MSKKIPDLKENIIQKLGEEEIKPKMLKNEEEDTAENVRVYGLYLYVEDIRVFGFYHTNVWKFQIKTKISQKYHTKTTQAHTAEKKNNKIHLR